MASASKQPGLAVITEPYGTGAHYVHELRRQGLRVAAVTQPAEQLPPQHRHALAANLYDHVLHGAFPTTISSLRDLGALHVFAGTDIGVHTADILAASLGLPGNPPATSWLRRDRGVMAAAAAGAGLAVPRGLVTGSLTDALEWLARLRNGCVLKPIDSAGSGGVALCSTPEQLRNAWRRQHRPKKAAGGTNKPLVVQERLRGQRYIVNTVTLPPAATGGQPHHVVAEIHRDRRLGDEDCPYPSSGPAHLHDRTDLLPLDGPLIQSLTLYVEHVLDALDVRNGPASTEVILTPDRGLVLLEANCGPMGAYDPYAMRLATGSDHIRDAVTGAVAGQLTTLDRRRLPMHVSTVTLISPGRSVLDDKHLQRLMELPTVSGHVGKLKPGCTIEKTTDLLTSPGRITLISTSQADIEIDYKIIRKEIEPNGLYQPLPLAGNCIW